MFLITTLVLAGSCVYHDITHTVNCDAVEIGITIDEQINATTCSAADGRITLHGDGGAAPYQYTLAGRKPRTTGTFDSLSSGLYTITIADKNGCQAVADSLLVSVENFSVTLTTTDDTDCVTGNGRVEVAVHENTGPYRYAIDGGKFQEANVMEGLRHGNHLLTIADANNCGVTKSLTINRGTTGVSWKNDILPIMQTRCAITGCHNGVSRTNDWRIYTQVKANAAEIRVRTQNKSMPFDNEMPQANIDLIACWIDEGAQNN